MAKKFPVITRERERVLLFQAVLRGDVNAAWEIVEGNMRFVYKMAHKISREMPVDDLASIGAMSLFNSIMNYDLSRPYQARVTSFAGIGIYRAMSKAQQKDGVVARPIATKEEIKKNVFEFSPEMGTEGIVDDLDLTIDDLNRADIQEKLRDSLNLLTRRERVVVNRRYAGHTLKSISEELDLSRERIRQLQESALGKLREHFNEEIEPAGEYTEADLSEFRRLLTLAESDCQTARIESKFSLPRFMRRIGKSGCDAMLEVLIAEDEAKQCQD